ncbi:MAG: hypothetical protein JXB36_16020 [Gammaproteobacteria bacterium]|nr:hypothetical protein [Gammaproteobacteria bacterium]
MRTRLLRLAVLSALLVSARAHANVEVDFIPSTAAHGYAARAYRAIWDEYGERIVAALEARTCLPFSESHVAAVIADAVSHSGGPEHPMRLRASYPGDVKRSTLVHELGHRHLWQLAERLDELDGHETLYLILDRVWADVWGDAFAEQRVGDEAGWRAEYDYAAAWTRARSMTPAERAHLWNRLLAMNGFPTGCDGPIAD